MAKKSSDKKPVVEVSKSVTKSTPVRNTPIPKVVAGAPAGKKTVGHGEIAVRAFEIAMSGTGGDEMSNWLRAERELGV